MQPSSLRPFSHCVLTVTQQQSCLHNRGPNPQDGGAIDYYTVPIWQILFRILEFIKEFAIFSIWEKLLSCFGHLSTFHHGTGKISEARTEKKIGIKQIRSK